MEMDTFTLKVILHSLHGIWKWSKISTLADCTKYV